ncbi:hypothetical protein LIER_00342 [Lithospermum erythrorhizon]|uniref:Uncharacterized protein n=1 Tax=Lithospermum erythrorhizon TaxID=34254 RepID=A0AAV3NKN3_LITER
MPSMDRLDGGPNETLKSYQKCYNDILLSIPEVNNKLKNKEGKALRDDINLRKHLGKEGDQNRPGKRRCGKQFREIEGKALRDDINLCNKKEIEKLIKGVYIKEFTEKGTQWDVNRQSRRSPPLPRIKLEPQEVPRLTRRINTISGDIARVGDSRNSRKNYARREVYLINQASSLKSEIISFLDKELIGIELQHDVTMVIAPIIVNYTVERIERERKLSRESHMEINREKSKADEHNSSKERENEKRAMPHEEVLIVPFKPENKEKTFRIGTKLGENLK